MIWLRRQDWQNTFRADMPFRVGNQLGGLHLGYIPPEDHPLNQEFMNAVSPEIIPAGTPIGHPYHDAVVVNLDNASSRPQSLGINRYKRLNGTRFVCNIVVIEDLKFTLAGKYPLYGEEREVPIHLEADQGIAIAKNIWENHLRYPQHLSTDSWGQTHLFVKSPIDKQAISPN